MLLRADDYLVSPWKNGGGVTREIATAPMGAGMADFIWRISMATVSEDGPFSCFDEIERTLFLLDGVGMELWFDGGETVTLAPGDVMEHFAGDTPVTARLLSGAITDLNIMTRRGCVTHSTKLLQIKGEYHVIPSVGTQALINIGTGLKLVQGERVVAFNPYDCLLLEANAAGVLLQGVGELVQVVFSTVESD